MNHGGARPGSGRKKSDDPRKNSGIAFSKKEKAKIQNLANCLGLSLSDVIIDAVRFYEKSFR